MEMTQETQKNVDDALSAFASKRLAIFGQVALYTVLTMVIMGGGGYLLDKWLGIYPALFITGLVLAFPMIQFVIYRKFKGYASNTLNK